MSNPPRKRQPIAVMDEEDRAAMERTARRGGLGAGAAPRAEPAPATALQTEQAKPIETVREGAGAATASDGTVADPTALFSRNDLRPQIAYGSELAQAVADAYVALDPVARRYVKPASMLKDFLVENDAALAKLYRKSSSRH